MRRKIINEMSLDDDDGIVDISSPEFFGVVNDARLRSKSSMKRFATIGDTGEPIDAPSDC